MTAKLPPGPGTPLIEYPWVVIRFRCHYCERGGDSRTVACAIDFGSHPALNELLHAFMRACPWNPHSKHRKPQKYGMKCGTYLPDIGRTSPPDPPPSMTGLTLIEGGKGDMLPAKPLPARERLKRVDDQGGD